MSAEQNLPENAVSVPPAETEKTEAEIISEEEIVPETEELAETSEPEKPPEDEETESSEDDEPPDVPKAHPPPFDDSYKSEDREAEALSDEVIDGIE